MRPRLRGYVRARLHRRLFMWFGAAILLTAVIAFGVVWLSQGQELGGWRRELERGQRLVGGQFERVWDRPAEREALASSISRELDVSVGLSDPDRRSLARFGAPCGQHHRFEAPVRREGRVIGWVECCTDRHHGGGPWGLLPPLIAVGLVLWAMAGMVSRRLARPLAELARVAREIGAGRLESRARLECRDYGEIGVVADAVNDMAARIERQVNDQRALLAGVSHELRTPLGHMRLLIEMARQGAKEPKVLDELEAEVLEVDGLVGQLLASARLDFAKIEPRPLDASEVARRALERVGLDPALLSIEGEPDLRFMADPTLLARALANLLDNAARHGGGARALRVSVGERAIVFEVDDAGPGFPDGEASRVFEPFYRRTSEPGSLGLGLALVKRISEAHGGLAYARNRPEGGGRVGIELPLRRGPGTPADAAA